jgi:hypothetical protein
MPFENIPSAIFTTIFLRAHEADLRKMDAKQNRIHCLVRALEYDRRAQETLDPVAQKTYRDMARQWRALADRAVITGVRNSD